MLFLPGRWLRPVVLGARLLAPLIGDLILFLPLPTRSLSSRTRLFVSILWMLVHSPLRQGDLNLVNANWCRLALLALASRPLIFLSGQMKHPATRLLLPVVETFAFAGLIAAAVKGISGPICRFFVAPLLLWLDRISYGLNLPHNFAPWLAPSLLHLLTEYRVSHFHNEFRHVSLLLGLSVVAAASWYLVEPNCDRFKVRLFRAA